MNEKLLEQNILQMVTNGFLKGLDSSPLLFASCGHKPKSTNNFASVNQLLLTCMYFWDINFLFV